MPRRFVIRKKQPEHRNSMLYGAKINDKLMQTISQ